MIKLLYIGISRETCRVPQSLFAIKSKGQTADLTTSVLMQKVKTLIKACIYNITESFCDFEN